MACRPARQQARLPPIQVVAARTVNRSGNRPVLPSEDSMGLNTAIATGGGTPPPGGAGFLVSGHSMTTFAMAPSPPSF